MKRIIIIVSCLFLLACQNNENSFISFDSKTGLLIFDSVKTQPDSNGILMEIPLEIPPFREAGYFSGDGGGQGFLPGNRNHLWLTDADFNILNEPGYGENPPFYLLKSPAGTQGTFAIFRLTNGEYLCLLPLAGTHSLSWMAFEAGKQPLLKIGTLGTAPVDVAVPVIAWAKSENLYEASYNIWKNQRTLRSSADSHKRRVENQLKQYYPIRFFYVLIQEFRNIKCILVF